jgi:hypothetical protein
MLSDLTIGVAAAFEDGRRPISPPNHMVGAWLPGTLKPNVRETGLAHQPLSRLLCTFPRGERQMTAMALAADRDGENQTAVSTAQRNRKVQ